MRFIDEVEIRVRAGKGGSGIVSFHRAPFVPKGGPDGGDGGRGGNVVFRASAQLSTLEDVTLHRFYRAENGRPGQGGKKSGRAGKDIVLKVPVGTLVWEVENDRLLVDLTADNQEFVVTRGGMGGRGNSRFSTPRNRTPRRSEPGLAGEERTIRIELKLIADVGLVGKPNAGKSTLLSVLTRAKPRIDAYPFSTLKPSLGIVPYGVYQRFVMADIPGFAEGARHGRGLGHQFLRHIQRTRLLIILIEATEENYQAAFNQLIEELDGFSDELSGIPRIVVISKSDLLESDKLKTDFPFEMKISSISGEGLEKLVETIAERLNLVQEVRS